MASCSTSLSFLTGLHHDVRYMIYDIVVRNQKIDVLNHTQTDIESLRQIHAKIGKEIEVWYQNKKHILYKHHKFGILLPSTQFTLTLAGNYFFKPLDGFQEILRYSGRYSLSESAHEHWIDLVRKDYGRVENLVIDLRLDRSEDVQAPMDVLNHDIIDWVNDFEKLSSYDIVLTPEQNTAGDVSLTEQIVKLSHLLARFSTRLVTPTLRFQFGDAPTAGAGATVC